MVETNMLYRTWYRGRYIVHGSVSLAHFADVPEQKVFASNRAGLCTDEAQVLHVSEGSDLLKVI